MGQRQSIYEQISDFVQYWGRNFSVETIAENLGFNPNSIRVYLNEMKSAGMIKEIDYRDKGKKMYVKVRHLVSNPRQDIPAEETLSKVLAYKDSKKTQREIAQELGISRSSVAMSFKELRRRGLIKIIPITTESLLACKREHIKRLIKKHNIQYNKDLYSMNISELQNEIVKIKEMSND
jgi:Mn-dependent DtxR family transcriptional regulator